MNYYPDETDCGRTIAIGAEDSATCDIPRTSRHTDHEGPCSLGGRARWQGGGSLMGDPLPIRNLELIPDEPDDRARHLPEEI